MEIKTFNKKIGWFFYGIFIKFSAYDVHFYKILIHFNLPLKLWKFPCNCLFLLKPTTKSNLFLITLDTSDHIHLEWLNIDMSLLLLPYSIQKTIFITQINLEIKLTHYLLSLWAVQAFLSTPNWSTQLIFSTFFDP